jgi:peptidoglycan pentaglycine glycine transferase (the first glycine)
MDTIMSSILENSPYKFHEITDLEAWDKYACSFPNTTFINSSSYGDFQKSLGFDFQFIGVFDEDSIEGLLPISVVSARRGKYIHLKHSPLIHWNNERLREEVIEYLIRYAKKNGASLVRISPLLLDNSENRNLLSSYGFKPTTLHEVDAEHTLALDLSMDEEEILKQMRKNTRYYIRKAEKMGIETEIYDDLSKFDVFWEIFMDAVVRNDWVPFSYEYVKNEMEVFLKKDQARMFLSKYKDKYIAGSIFTYFNDQSFYHHSGSLTEFRNVPSTYALQWEAIKYAKSRGCREYNFWGVVDNEDLNHPWYGLSLFKKGFGGKERKMIHAHDKVLNFKGHALRFYEFLERKMHGF